MGSGPEKIKAMLVRAERHGHFAKLLLVGGFDFSAIASWRGATDGIDLL